MPETLGVPPDSLYDLTRTMRAVSRELGVGLTLYDMLYLVKNSGKMKINRYFRHHDGCRYCKEINTRNSQPCTIAEAAKLKHIEQGAGPMVLECPMGIRDIALPVESNGKLIAVIFLLNIIPFKAVPMDQALTLDPAAFTIHTFPLADFPGEQKLIRRAIDLLEPLIRLLQSQHAMQELQQAYQSELQQRTADPTKIVRYDVLKDVPLQINLPGPFSPGVERVLTWLRHNYHRPFPLAKAAQMAGLSVFHFCKVFQKETTYTFYNLILAYRLEASVYLLKKTRLKFIEIANVVGFTNSSSFSRAFRRRFRISPREARLRPVYQE